MSLSSWILGERVRFRNPDMTLQEGIIVNIERDHVIVDCEDREITFYNPDFLLLRMCAEDECPNPVMVDEYQVQVGYTCAAHTHSRINEIIEDAARVVADLMGDDVKEWLV